MKRGYVLLAAVAAMALLVALFAMVGTAAAQDQGIDVEGPASVEGVNNEAETCVGESCNTGNVADVEVENDCIIAAVNVGIIVGDSGIIINDACNTDIEIIQSQGPTVKEVVVVEEVKAVQQEAAAKGAALPVTGAMLLTVGLLGTGLTTAGLALWRRA